MRHSLPVLWDKNHTLVWVFQKTESRVHATGFIKLKVICYAPKTGYSGINELSQKSTLPSTFVKEWLQRQKVYTLHIPVRHKFNPRRVLGLKINDQWQLTKNNLMLTVTDIFSKYPWVIQIKQKTDIEISKAFNIIFKERKPKKFQIDMGLEF